jgi:hypothetical protein
MGERAAQPKLTMLIEKVNVINISETVLRYRALEAKVSGRDNTSNYRAKA